MVWLIGTAVRVAIGLARSPSPSASASASASADADAGGLSPLGMVGHGAVGVLQQVPLVRRAVEGSPWVAGACAACAALSASSLAWRIAPRALRRVVGGTAGWVVGRVVLGSALALDLAVAGPQLPPLRAAAEALAAGSAWVDLARAFPGISEDTAAATRSAVSHGAGAYLAFCSSALAAAGQSPVLAAGAWATGAVKLLLMVVAGGNACGVDVPRLAEDMLLAAERALRATERVLDPVFRVLWVPVGWAAVAVRSIAAVCKPAASWFLEVVGKYVWFPLCRLIGWVFDHVVLRVWLAGVQVAIAVKERRITWAPPLLSLAASGLFAHGFLHATSAGAPRLDRAALGLAAATHAALGMLTTGRSLRGVLGGGRDAPAQRAATVLETAGCALYRVCGAGFMVPVLVRGRVLFWRIARATVSFVLHPLYELSHRLLRWSLAPVRAIVRAIWRSPESSLAASVTLLGLVAQNASAIAAALAAAGLGASRARTWIAVAARLAASAAFLASERVFPAGSGPLKSPASVFRDPLYAWLAWALHASVVMPVAEVLSFHIRHFEDRIAPAYSQRELAAVAFEAGGFFVLSVLTAPTLVASIFPRWALVFLAPVYTPVMLMQLMWCLLSYALEDPLFGLTTPSGDDGAAGNAKDSERLIARLRALPPPPRVFPSDACPICIERWDEPGSDTASARLVLPCGHGFHAEPCLAQWLARPGSSDPRCPYCRSKVRA